MTRNWTLWASLVAILLLGGCSVNPGSETGTFDFDVDETRCLALSMYWEAKAEGAAGMRAVGHVVLNRVRDERFPDKPCAVVEQGGERRGCQFSWYCDGKSDAPTEAANWRAAQRLAEELQRGEHRDSTKGALFFHATRLKTPWRVPRTKTATIGKHAFYR